MDKRTRKRKNADAERFSLESLEQHFSAKRASKEQLSANIAYLHGIDMSSIDDVEEEEALVILSSKITFSGVLFLKAAIRHVPKT